MDRVLEVGGWGAGYAGRLLVHAGADVVRIDTGLNDPAWASDEAMAAYLHPGKRRVASNDLSLLADMACASDVVICQAQTADELRALGFDTWDAKVKIGITPFGMTGPKQNWRATPSTLLAMGGYTYLMGDPDRAPLSLPGHYVEFQAGALAVGAANSSRWQAGKTVAGESGGSTTANRVVDIGMLETLMALSQFTTIRWHCAQDIRTRHGSDFHFVVPSELFRCADGWAYVNIVPQFWDPFVVFLERPELAVDDRFTNNDLRIINKVALHALIADALADVEVSEVSARAETCRVPIGVLKTLTEVLAEPHLAERGFWEQINGVANSQSIKLPGVPYRFDGEPRANLRLEAPSDG